MDAGQSASAGLLTEVPGVQDGFTAVPPKGHSVRGGAYVVAGLVTARVTSIVDVQSSANAPFVQKSMDAVTVRVLVADFEDIHVVLERHVATVVVDGDVGVSQSRSRRSDERRSSNSSSHSYTGKRFGHFSSLSLVTVGPDHTSV